MKLASLKKGGLDGTLVVVSRDLTRAIEVAQIAPTLQWALENWDSCAPRLEGIYASINRGALDGEIRFDQRHAASPLPRAYQWCDGSVYLNHAELVRKARNAEMPPILYREPMLYQGGSDKFLAPHDEILLEDEAWGLDLEAEIAVVTGEVRMGTSRELAASSIRLVMAVNDVSLRNLMPDELSKGFGFFVSKPPTAFSPVAVTPDELGDAWDGTKLSLPIISTVNGTEIGRPDAGQDMNFDFADLIVHAAKTRPLCAGTIVGSGTVSNRDASVGSSCLQEIRMLEKLSTGAITTPHLRYGDRVTVEVSDHSGANVFGTIDQTVRKYEPH